MSVLEIITYPNPRLKTPCDDVKKINSSILKLLDDMAETMYDAPGVGLSAPQVGQNIRVIVVDISSSEEGGKDMDLIELINPVITSSSGKQIGEEGCLSVPGFLTNVTRHLNVIVEGLNREGKTIKIEATDLLSRVLQHEIDHLDGILFFDRLGKLKKDLLIKKIDKVLV